MTRDEMLARWQARRDEFLRLHLMTAAELAADVVADLAALARSEEEATLSLREASLASGYSADHLRHLIDAGKLPNAGRKGAPRIRRADLPQRPQRPTPARYDVEADARAIAGRIGAQRP